MEEEGRKWETHVRDARGVGESWDGKVCGGSGMCMDPSLMGRIP
jgi:hypothetical protein